MEETALGGEDPLAPRDGPPGALWRIALASFALGNLVWWLGRPVEGGTLVFWVGQALIGLALWIAGELTAARVFAWRGWAQEDPLARILLLTVLWCLGVAVLAPAFLLLLGWHGIVTFDLAQLREFLVMLLGLS